MINKLIFLLIDLKDNFSKDKMDEALKWLNDEITPDNLYEKEIEFRKAFNGQNDNFYNSLSIDFVNDLNEMPDLYFLKWESFLDFFDVGTKCLFLQKSVENANNTDATDYLNGLIELDNNRPEIGLFHFNRIDDYVACYFIALCYFELDNFENSIKNNIFFIDKFDVNIEGSDVKEIGKLKEEFNYKLLRFNVHSDLAYCYNRVGDYTNAFKHYEKVLEIFNLYELYSFRHNENEEQNTFILDVNNMLLAIDKVGRYSKGIEVLSFVITKYPHNNYYQELKQKFEAKLSHISLGDDIINKVFRRKKPFGIEKFEATKLIAKEKILEDLIIEQIKYGFKVFGKDLEVYQDTLIFGRQYYLPTVNGILDLLLIDKVSNTLYIIELKRNEAGVEVVEQIERYILGLQQAFSDREVKGIICLHKSDNKLIELVNTKPNIELFTYEFTFTEIK